MRGSRMSRNTVHHCFLIAAFLGTGALAGSDKPDLAFQPQLRRPVALALADQGRWLFVANQRSGSVTVIDTDTSRPIAEVAVGRRLADLVALPDGRHLLAADEEAH